jgi:hypothetical protein
MFDQAHYVPVLRWKSGERGALRDLSTGDRHLIMPLIELLPGHLRPRRGKDGPVTADDLWVFVEQIVDVWGPSPALLDVSRVQGVPYRGSLDHSAAKMFSALGAAGLHVIPTTWLRQPAGFQKTTREAAKIDNRGVALRVPIPPRRASRMCVAVFRCSSTGEPSLCWQGRSLPISWSSGGLVSMRFLEGSGYSGGARSERSKGCREDRPSETTQSSMLSTTNPWKAPIRARVSDTPLRPTGSSCGDRHSEGRRGVPGTRSIRQMPNCCAHERSSRGRTTAWAMNICGRLDLTPSRVPGHRRLG